MKRNKSLAIVICLSFLAVLFLPGLVRNVRGEEGKTSLKEGYSEEKEEFQRKMKEKLKMK